MVYVNALLQLQRGILKDILHRCKPTPNDLVKYRFVDSYKTIVFQISLQK